MGLHRRAAHNRQYGVLSQRPVQVLAQSGDKNLSPIAVPGQNLNLNVFLQSVRSLSPLPKLLYQC
jgi:hypothetical protein